MEAVSARDAWQSNLGDLRAAWEYYAEMPDITIVGTRSCSRLQLKKLVAVADLVLENLAISASQSGPRFHPLLDRVSDSEIPIRNRCPATSAVQISPTAAPI